MPDNSREDDFSRLELSLHAIKHALFCLTRGDETTSDSFPHLSKDFHQVAVIMQRLDMLPASKYPRINGIISGSDAELVIDEVLGELKGVLRDATTANELHEKS